MTKKLFELAPDLDRGALSRTFAAEGRVQIRNVLTSESARELRRVVETETPWGIAWQAGSGGPQKLRRDEVARLSPNERRTLGTGVMEAAARGEYAAQFSNYPILDAYLEKWSPGDAFDILFEHINDEPFLDLARQVTGLDCLIKADAQATLFTPGQFLARHIDAHSAEGWRVAYVLNLTDENWNPDWGGYLSFLDDDGDIITGWKPRFNSLNLFRVPQPHHVSYVPPFAQGKRLAITGWFRDR